MVVEQIELLDKVNKVLGQDCKNLSFLETIEALVDHIEKVDKEFQAMSEAIAEGNTMNATYKMK